MCDGDACCGCRTVCYWLVCAVIAADRFIARSSTDREAWLWNRSQGITATAVSRGFTASGFAEVVAQMENPRPITPSALMEWGNIREPHIAQIVKERYGVFGNDWLISKGGPLSSDRWQMCTPDGLSLDHALIGEYKTSGKPLDKIPAHYMRQCQWQMYVCDAERLLFAYELRLDAPGGMYAPGFDVHCQFVERDEKFIKELIVVAEKLQTINVYKSWEEREGIENGYLADS